jgi:branched-chain amino acid transport system substrate-binding protein
MLLATTGVVAEPRYDTGADDTAIKVGHINPYSGPLSAYGAIGRGHAAYFDMINEQGGINGRRIEFITLDDGYSPPKTVEQVRRLVEKEEVLLLFGMSGTPTNTAVHRYINAKKMPHLFLLTGASKWGQPKKYPWTMGWQPPYSVEAKVYAKYILETVEDPRIAILYQNDDYGKDYVDGFKEQLGDKASALIIAETTYQPLDPTIDAQIVELANSGANVFFNVTVSKFASQSIRRVHDLGWEPLHILNNVSTSVEAVLAIAGLDKAVGVVSSAFVKDPTDPQWANDEDIKAWSAWMDQYNPDADKRDVFNVLGYSMAITIATVLERCGDDLTRENVIRQAASLDNVEIPLLLPGVTLNTGADDFYPIQQLQLMRFDGEIWQRFGEVIEVE